MQARGRRSALARALCRGFPAGCVMCLKPPVQPVFQAGVSRRAPPAASRRSSSMWGVMNTRHMKLSKPHRVILSACIALLASPPVIGAEIYKWVDAAGKTHYSENKKEAEAANGRRLEVNVLPPSSPSIDPRPSPSRSPEASVKPPGPARGQFTPPAVEKPKPFSARDETDAGKCHLARSILNGSARHSNMKPTDAYDRQVAESDVRIFCK